MLALVVLEVLALALWFSGTAAGPGMLREAAQAGAGFQAMLTGAVQAGFELALGLLRLLGRRCGMDVVVDDDALRGTRDGVEHFFCGPGCREHYLAGA